VIKFVIRLIKEETNYQGDHHLLRSFQDYWQSDKFMSTFIKVSFTPLINAQFKVPQ
jgi:hypothetical protein